MSVLNLRSLETAFRKTELTRIQGTVTRASGLIIEATLPEVAVGTSCDITATDGRMVPAEVVGFSSHSALLMPLGETHGIGGGCKVTPRGAGATVPVGEELLGRVVDAEMRPIDGKPAPLLRGVAPLSCMPPSAMARRRIANPMVLGVRSIDSLLTLGEGQRVGVMAGPGVGKSVLLGMVAKHSAADIIVAGLIGERGREVREFVERDLGEKGLARSIVIVATGDEPPLVRVRAAMAATAVAEYFRARGKRVMLLMDSLSRVAMAQREIGLAAGEPPTSKGYPPSVFAMLPRLLERAGNDAGQGSITGIYTALAEGDDLSDPVVDAARSVLDGHIILSRKLAGAGHFPAVDVLASISRVMSDIVTPQHRDMAQSARDVLSAYRESADLIEVGAYQPGSNPRVDRAIACLPAVNSFLKQGPDEHFAFPQTLDQLSKAVKVEPPKEKRRV